MPHQGFTLGTLPSSSVSLVSTSQSINPPQYPISARQVVTRAIFGKVRQVSGNSAAEAHHSLSGQPPTINSLLDVTDCPDIYAQLLIDRNAQAFIPEGSNP